MPTDYLRLSRLLSLSAESRTITNIGNIGTDFSTLGGLTLASNLGVTGLSTITNETDAASVQIAILQGDRDTPTDNDTAYITLRLSDSVGNQDEQARISWSATTVADGATQDGDLILSALVNGSLTEFFRLDGSASHILLATTLNWNGISATGTLADAGIVTTIDINGGTVDGAIIGAAAAAAATVTALVATSLDLNGALDLDVAGLSATITNTTDAASVQIAILEGDRATPTDADTAYLTLRLSDSVGNQDEQARITWVATTVADGATQDGDLILSALVNGSLTEMLRLDGSASQVDFAVEAVFPDNINTTFGTGEDAAIYYDGTHLKIQPRDVGSGNVHVNDDCLVWIGTTGRSLDGTFTTTDATVGIVVNQGAADNPVLVFKSSDVAHGITNSGGVETDTWAILLKAGGTAGGYELRGFSEATLGARIAGIGLIDITGKTAGSRAYVVVDAGKGSGSNVGLVGTNANIFEITDWGTAIFIVDKEGDVHANGQFIAGFGDGETTTRTGTTVRAPNVATGGASNIDGADLTIAPGLGTGTGDEGTLIFQLPIQAAPGDFIQTIATRLTLDMAGSTTQLTFNIAQNLLIQRASTAGVAASFIFDIPIGAGGAADAVVKHEFQLDGTARSGLFTETDGAGGDDTTVTIWRVPYRDSGASVGTPGSPDVGNNATWNGGIRIEAGDDTNRIYFFTNEAWHYVNQTAGLSFTADEREMYGHKWEVGDLGLVIVDRHFSDGGPHGLLYPANQWLEDVLPDVPVFNMLQDRVKALEETNRTLRNQLVTVGMLPEV